MDIVNVFERTICFLKLSHFIIFQSLRFEHVIILDESCRIHETHEPHNSNAHVLPIPPELLRTFG